jgi:hypothetical protein
MRALKRWLMPLLGLMMLVSTGLGWWSRARRSQPRPAHAVPVDARRSPQ